MHGVALYPGAGAGAEPESRQRIERPRAASCPCGRRRDACCACGPTRSTTAATEKRQGHRRSRSNSGLLSSYPQMQGRARARDDQKTHGRMVLGARPVGCAMPSMRHSPRLIGQQIGSTITDRRKPARLRRSGLFRHRTDKRTDDALERLQFGHIIPDLVWAQS